MLPGTTCKVQIFPAGLVFQDVDGPEPVLKVTASANIEGPVKDFTIQQDLEKECVVVWGHAANGYFRYRLQSESEQVTIAIERCGESGIAWQFHDAAGNALGEETLNEIKVPLIKGRGKVDGVKERLSLGYHKSQDWDLVIRRHDMGEVFPFWLRLSHFFPQKAESEEVGTLSLLAECREAIQRRDILQIVPLFQSVFQAGFEGILSPRLDDAQHQGFHLKPVPKDSKASPLKLLCEGGRMIRSLFIQANQEEVAILPVLPPQFHCGRLVGLEIPGVGNIDLEWSKHRIRRLVFEAAKSGTLNLRFQKEIRQYRFREGNKDRGVIILNKSSINFVQGSRYFLDCFEL